MAKVLITGGAGFIGSYIVRELIEQGHEPIVLDIYAQYIPPTEEGYKEHRANRFKGILDKVTLERGDSSNFSVIYPIIKKHKPDYIIHLAALPLAKLQNITAEEALNGSVISTANLLEVVSQLKESGDLLNFKKFVYTSSSMVYGDFQSNTASETHPTNPKEVYGTMKLAGEYVTKGLCNTFNLPYTIIRPSAVYGPTDMNKRVSQIFLDNAIKGETLTLFGGDEEKLDFSFVKDVAKGFILATFSEQAHGEVFNITGGNGRSLLEYANTLKQHIPELKIEIKPRDESKPKRGTLEIEKARNLLNYNPEYDLEKGIEEYVKFVRSQN